MFREAKLDIGAYFGKYIQSNVNLAAVMKGAKRINEFKREGD